MNSLKIVAEFAPSSKQHDISFEDWRRAQYAQSQVMEYYLRDLTFRMGELLLVVVNDLTVLDQKFIDLLTTRCKNYRGKKQVVVIHNFKEVSTEEELEAVWKVCYFLFFIFNFFPYLHFILATSSGFFYGQT